MIHCVDCINYKTKIITDPKDPRANTVAIGKALKQHGRQRAYFCDYGDKHLSSKSPCRPLKHCRSYNFAGDVCEK